MRYGDFNYLPRRTVSDKILNNIAFISKIPKYVGYQRGFSSMFYKFFNKNASGVHLEVKLYQTNN